MTIGRVQLEHYQSIYDDMADMIARRKTSALPTVVFMFELPRAISKSLYPIFSTHRTLSVGRPHRRAYRSVMLLSLLADADFLVTITPTGEAHTVPKLYANFPASLTLLWAMRASARVAAMG